MSELCDFGLIGLAVMGENLALNVESRGFRVAVFNRTIDKVDAFIGGRAAGKQFVGCHSLADLVANLKRPRKVMMLVKAGKAVDELLEQIVPLLEPGDVVIDGGNEHFSNTERRTKEIEQRGLLYVGSGVSGGEEGALKGPSLMPGGTAAAWDLIRPIFQAIAAKVGPKGDVPCCEWVGPRGAGHYVKMVHNGIEYGDMQLICEAYLMLKETLGLSNAELYDERFVTITDPSRSVRGPCRDHGRCPRSSCRGPRSSTGPRRRLPPGGRSAWSSCRPWRSG